jgi:hypothetical protein
LVSWYWYIWDIYNFGDNVASGLRSVASYLTTASGVSSFSQGQNTKANGDGSHAQGGTTIASGIYSHAQGNATTASGMFSHLRPI